NSVFIVLPIHTNIRCEPYSAQCANHIPAQIHLPPVAAEAGRGGRCVMVAVPVLSPCSELERAEPPDVLAGIDSFRKSRLQMQKTVHYGLHVKAIDKADGAKPEKARPAKQKITQTDRRDDERDLKLRPDRISKPDQIRTPLLHR